MLRLVTLCTKVVYFTVFFCNKEDTIAGKGFEPYSLAGKMRGHFGAERPVALRSATPAGATFARALASELADALRSVICAAALRRRADDNPFFSAKKKKPRYPKGYRGFLAEKKGFEPSRRLPDLHP